MAPNPSKAAQPFDATVSLAAAAKGSGATSAVDAANAASARVTKQREAGKTKRVPVVVTKTGYDGLRERHPGEHLKWPLAEGEKLPSWVQPEAEWERDQQRLADDDEE